MEISKSKNVAVAASGGDRILGLIEKGGKVGRKGKKRKTYIHCFASWAFRPPPPPPPPPLSSLVGSVSEKEGR